MWRHLVCSAVLRQAYSAVVTKFLEHIVCYTATGRCIALLANLFHPLPSTQEHFAVASHTLHKMQAIATDGVAWSV